jgi:NADPH:quinone reductase-like Zn-dependent oxidoreductase
MWSQLLREEVAMGGEQMTSMRAVVHDRHGDPGQVLRLEESLPVIAPGRGEVLVRISVRPIHPGDVAIVAIGGDGSLLARPRVPGFEGAGTVVVVGPDVLELEPGQRVALFLFPTPGAWGEYLTTSASSLVPIPDDIDDATASMVLINPFTARMLLRTAEDAWAGPPRPTLQTAAGSSVGRFVAAAAEGRGYLLVNLVRSPQGAAELGTRFPSLSTFSTSGPNWSAQARMTLGSSAAVALDAVGGTMVNELLDLLEDGGTVVNYGALSGSPPSEEDLARQGRGLRLRPVSVGSVG